MRSFGRCAAAVALVAVWLSATPHAQSSQAATLYQQARALEAGLRKELGAGSAATPASADLLARMRTLSRTYEDLWRLFPTSPYSDDALWYGAMMAGDAFGQSGDAPDRARALRMFQALTANFPTSSLLKRVPAQVTRLESTQPAEPPVRADGSSRPPAQPAALPAASPSAVETSRTASATATATSTVSAMLMSIRREVLPDVLRVTLELDREPAFSSEQIDGPPRVFIDMQNTRASAAVRDAQLPYKDDLVRQIRVGRQLNGRIRVVMDLSATGKYSVYALYTPFRIVIDFDRRQPGTQPAVQRAAIQPTPPPSAGEANKPRPTNSDAVTVARPSSGQASQTTAPRSTTAANSAAATVPAAPAPVTRPAATSSPANSDTAAVGRPSSAPPGDPARARPTSPQAPASPTTTPPAAAAAPATTAAAGRTRPTLGKGPEPGDSFTPPTAVASAGSVPAASATTPNVPPAAPSANSTGSFSLSRQLGLGIARIVIDPGHGGHDPGAQVKGLSEAEVTLDIALRLEKLFTKQSGVQVVLTRRDDTFVPLQERTAIANRTGADLFLSIHANANEDTALRGVETYFLNLSPNPEAGRIAARENAASSKTMHDFTDIVKAIALNDKIDESRDFATLVQTALYEKLQASNRNIRNLGVKQAPFMVLVGATMPSILAEISFLTNKQDAALLKTEKYRQQIAEALYQGVMKYQQALKRVPAVAAR